MAIENIDLSKFEKLFLSMERQLIMQSSFLESMYNLAVDEREDRISRENELDVARIEERARFDQQYEDGPPPEVTADQRNSLFSSLFNMLPGILSGISLAGAGAALISAGLLAAVAPAISDFVSGFVKQGLDYVLPNMGEDGKEIIADTIGDATVWGLAWKVFSKIFGKKIAGIFAIGGFLYQQISKWLDPDGENTEMVAALAIAGTAVASFIPKIIQKVFGKTPEAKAPGGGGAAAKPPTGEAAPKPSKGFLSGMNKALKGIAKSVPVISGILSAAAEYAESGDASAAISEGAGSTAGAIVGGAIGSLIGPLGTIAGSVVGSVIGEAVGGGFNEWAETPTESAAPPIVGDYTSPTAQPNRQQAYEEEQKRKKEELTQRYKESGVYGEFNPAEGAAKTSAMIIPGITTDQTGAIQRPMLATPLTPIPEPISSGQSRLDKLEQMYQKSLAEKSAVTAMNSFSSPTTIGGATTINNTNSTVIMTADAGRSLDSFILA